MKRRILLAFVLIGTLAQLGSAQASECDCQKDMAFLMKKMKKIPAYKVNKKQVEQSYEQLIDKAETTASIYDCYVLLSTLALSLNDNHSKIYGQDKGVTKEILADPEKTSSFKKSSLYHAYPITSMDLDSLRTALHDKAKEEIEGIYYKDNIITIGVVKEPSTEVYKGIVLETDSPIWRAGEIVYTLIPFGNEYLLNIAGNLSTKRMIAYTERIGQGFFYYMGLKKDKDQTNYSSAQRSSDTYYREEISDNISYIKVGSFNSWYPTLSDAEAFYASLDGNLKKPHLIVDLRNNGGGGDRNSDILYKLIKDYAKQNHVHVLINHRSVSNAEQFAHKLSKLDHCQLYGQRTNGTLAYEVKDNSPALPEGHFITVLASKKHSEYLKYESVGITPDVTLDLESDWIDQVVQYITAME